MVVATRGSLLLSFFSFLPSPAMIPEYLICCYSMTTQSPPIDLLSQWSDADYWKKLCPYLTISTDENSLATDNDTTIGPDDDNVNKQLLERLIDDGYALVDNKICNDSLREKLARGISDMEIQHTLPATFVILFDECWKLAEASHRHLLQQKNGNNVSNQSILHPNNMAFNFDMLAWHIDPRMNQAGFSPHRDRQPHSLNDLKNSFYAADGQAKYITHWIALTDATPENSCLYVIPKQYDPGYMKGDDDDIEVEVENANRRAAEDEDNHNSASNDNIQLSDPLSRALNSKQSYQNIRALPRKAGQSLIFTHRILHWGSKGNQNSLNVQPRIAVSFVYSDVEFEAPYLSTKESLSMKTTKTGGNWIYPTFSTRLLLVCAQLLIYYQRFNLSTATLRACYEYCKSHSNQLDSKYQKKVFVEYVKAMKERRDGIQNVESNNQNETGMMNGGNDDGANSDDEEALLEEMLNNSDEFEDDYDDMCDDGHDYSRKRKHDA